MLEVADGIYFESRYRSGNVGCVATLEGAILIDSPMLPSDASDWLKQIGTVSREGIAFLINTDYLVERVLGNCYFPAATIAHQLAWVEMQRYDESYLQRFLSHEKIPDSDLHLSRTRIVPPELGFVKEMTIYTGERELRLRHVGGHTSASIMVHLSQSRVLFTGNVVTCGEHPSLGQANTLRWLHVLEQIRAMSDVEVIVPGRGGVCSLADVDILIDYITRMRERVYENFLNDYTRRETVDKVKMQDFFPFQGDARDTMERRVRSSVERVYDEFKKEGEKKRATSG